MVPMDSLERHACGMIIGTIHLLTNIMIVIQGELGNLHPAAEY